MFQPEDNNFPVIPAPSMRRRGSGDSASMDMLIRRTLDEDEEGDVVTRLADRIAQVRNPTGKPMPLKRYETT